jgi:hypothetical protein
VPSVSPTAAPTEVPIAEVKFEIGLVGQNVDSVSEDLDLYKVAIAATIQGVLPSQVDIQIKVSALRQRILTTVTLQVTIQSPSIDSAGAIEATVADTSTFVAALGTELEGQGVDSAIISAMVVDSSSVSSTIIAPDLNALGLTSSTGEQATTKAVGPRVEEQEPMGPILGGVGAIVLLIAAMLVYRCKRGNRRSEQIGLAGKSNAGFKKSKSPKGLDTRIFVDPGLDTSVDTSLDSPANCMEQGELHEEQAEWQQSAADQEVAHEPAKAGVGLSTTPESVNRHGSIELDLGGPVASSEPELGPSLAHPGPLLAAASSQSGEKSDGTTPRHGSLPLDGPVPSRPVSAKKARPVSAKARPGSAKKADKKASLDGVSAFKTPEEPARASEHVKLHTSNRKKRHPARSSEKRFDSDQSGLSDSGKDSCMSDSGKESGFDTDEDGVTSASTLTKVPALPQRMASRRQSVQLAENALASLHQWVGKKVKVVSGKHKKREGVVRQVILWAHNAHLPEVKVSFEGEKHKRRVLQRRLKLLEPLEDCGTAPTAPLLGEDVVCGTGQRAGDRGHVVACAINTPRQAAVAYYVRFEADEECGAKAHTLLAKAKDLTVAPEMPTQAALDRARRPSQLLQPLPTASPVIAMGGGGTDCESDFGMSDAEREVMGTGLASDTDFGISDAEREVMGHGSDADFGLSDVERELGMTSPSLDLRL